MHETNEITYEQLGVVRVVYIKAKHERKLSIKGAEKLLTKRGIKYDKVCHVTRVMVDNEYGIVQYELKG